MGMGNVSKWIIFLNMFFLCNFFVFIFLVIMLLFFFVWFKWLVCQFLSKLDEKMHQEDALEIVIWIFMKLLFGPERSPPHSN